MFDYYYYYFFHYCKQIRFKKKLTTEKTSVCLCPSPVLESLLSHSILSPSFSLQDWRICRLHFHINPDKIDGGKAETAKRCAINLWITPLIIIAGNGLNHSKSTHMILCRICTIYNHLNTNDIHHWFLLGEVNGISNPSSILQNHANPPVDFEGFKMVRVNLLLSHLHVVNKFMVHVQHRLLNSIAHVTSLMLCKTFKVPGWFPAR